MLGACLEISGQHSTLHSVDSGQSTRTIRVSICLVRQVHRKQGWSWNDFETSVVKSELVQYECVDVIVLEGARNECLREEEAKWGEWSILNVTSICSCINCPEKDLYQLKLSKQATPATTFRVLTPKINLLTGQHRDMCHAANYGSRPGPGYKLWTKWFETANSVHNATSWTPAAIRKSDTSISWPKYQVDFLHTNRSKQFHLASSSRPYWISWYGPKTIPLQLASFRCFVFFSLWSQIQLYVCTHL